MELKSSRLKCMNRRTPLFYCFSIFFFSVCALFTTFTTTRTARLDIKCPLSGKSDLQIQDFVRAEESGSKDGEAMINSIRRRSGLSLSLARRYLSGPGSSPPRCTSKCGRCTPCKPVHVPVPPGTPVTTEYYPEAWRCKCGNRLYMP